MLDRIDLHVEVTPVAFSELSNKEVGESSIQIRERVIEARKIQEETLCPLRKGIHANAQISSKTLKENL